MVLTTLADGVWRSVENVQDTISGTFFEPVIRLGVTGLSRAGKTVFITSFVANLLDRGRMPNLLAAGEGRITAAYLQPQPDDTVPRFEFETHLSAMTGRPPEWPESTRSISELRVSLRVKPSGLLSGLQGPRTIHIDIVDYPGEWLLDLALLDQTYGQWSSGVLNRIKSRSEAKVDSVLLFLKSNTMRLTAKGQVTIPQRLRQRYGLKPESEVVVEETTEGVLIKPAHSDRLQKLKKAIRKTKGTATLFTSDELMRMTRGED